MPLTQTIIATKNGVIFENAQSAHRLLIDDTAAVTTSEILTKFQHVYNEVEMMEFQLDLELVDGALHMIRSWSDEEKYQTYKLAISNVEPLITEALETIDWKFNENVK